MVISFYSGPTKLPEEVMIDAQREFLNSSKIGTSIMEISHRSVYFGEVLNTTLQSIRNTLNVPDNYKVLLLQGGTQAGFAGVALNLIGCTGAADYIVTGNWSMRAAKEASKYGKVNLVLPEVSKHTTIPDQSKWKLNSNASFVYYCDNETAEGIEFSYIPESNGVPLVCDMASSIFSKPIDITKFGVIFGGAQKNFGPAGITLYIIREDLLNHELPITPAVMSWKANYAENNLLNTVPNFNVYMTGKILDWMKKSGGINAMYENSQKKSQSIYNLIDNSDGFYNCLIEKASRSRMNVVFRVGGKDGNETLEKKFVEEAEALEMWGLAGHTAVGGIRASLYNAITIEETETLVNYMKEFLAKNKE